MKVLSNLRAALTVAETTMLLDVISKDFFMNSDRQQLLWSKVYSALSMTDRFFLSYSDIGYTMNFLIYMTKCNFCRNVRLRKAKQTVDKAYNLVNLSYSKC